MIILFYYYSFLEYKNTKKAYQSQNICEKITCFQTILVISQAILKKNK